MSLEDLEDDLTERATDLGDELSVSLDRETRTELALLSAAFEPDEADELVRRAIHTLFQTSVERGAVDFHLRNKYDVTYDEYLSGMTFDQMTGGMGGMGGAGGMGGMGNSPQDDPDDRRYQF
jgi:hypothetical protein